MKRQTRKWRYEWTATQAWTEKEKLLDMVIVSFEIPL
jgi:hypothetical protein